MAHHQVVTASQPLLIPEITHLICSFVHPGDMLAVALSCRTMYYAMIARLWHTLHPRSHMELRKLKNTLDGAAGTAGWPGKTISTSLSTLDPQYNRQVRVFRWSLKEDVTTHMFERPFFDHFLFPRLHTLVFSYAAAQDSSVATMIKAAVHHLRYVDLSHCYCLSSDAIQPLLFQPHGFLTTLILYGCGKIDPHTLVQLIHHHHTTLTCVRLTDITDTVLDSLQPCAHLQDLGLEHCSDDDLTEPALTRFTRHQPWQMRRLRFRDIASLTSTHLANLMARKSLVHLDMSECSRITSDGLARLACLCPRLDTLTLAYQTGVSNSSLRAFATHCPVLRHLDVAGSHTTSSALRRRWTTTTTTTTTAAAAAAAAAAGDDDDDDGADGEAADVLTDDAFLAGRFDALHTLNLSGLASSQLSTDLIYHVLLQWPALQELCLGVAYDLTEAKRILANVNATGSCFYQMNVEKCHTICRVAFL
ncbi:hypothetical protein BCR42DRAFT_495614 [Absidia repens]|uniref:F-box domain-containing protein n=1 Tax=Absidia repens TaxID=90262 RepID=A0A1X2I333_9FUNG|nr:hypothetical protein BCR42DRAFT_495614 [Absidia repens]